MVPTRKTKGLTFSEERSPFAAESIFKYSENLMRHLGVMNISAIITHGKENASLNKNFLTTTKKIGSDRGSVQGKFGSGP
jgi:hypothetical protein